MSYDEKVLKHYIKLGFTNLTEIQRVTYTKILNHDMDLIVSAPTGSGKTEAVIIPLLIKLAEKGLLRSEGILVLYITPLRALNRDLGKRLNSICKVFVCNVDIWHSDTPSTTRKKIIKTPPHILLTTPESLQILLIKKEFIKHFSKLYAVIIDEIQELIQDERGAELLLAMERLDTMLGRHIRRIAITATLNEDNLRFMGKVLFSNRHFDVAIADSKKRYEADVMLSTGNYQWGFFAVGDIVKKISEIVKSKQHRQILIFTNTRTSAEELSYLLKSEGELDENAIGLHHGSLSRGVREAIEKNFKEGQIRVAISTSSLELGIDIGAVDLVIQYLSPRQVTKLLQRIGRAGHREDEVSKGVIVSPPIISELVESIIIAKRLERGDLEPLNIHVNSLAVLAHQLVGLALERDSILLTHFWKIAKRSLLFQDTSFDTVKKLTQFLNDIGLLKCHQDEQDVICNATKRGYIYYVTTNMIPNTNEYRAKSITDHKVIALLDEDFVALCNQDDVIVLGGNAWRIINVDYDEKSVWLSPLLDARQVILPKWVGENIPVHEKVARETCSFLRRFCACRDETCVDRLFNSYKINESVRVFLVANKDNLCKVYPSDNILTIELHRIPKEDKSLIAVYHCLGSRGSEAFSLALLRILREYLNVGGSYKSHQLGTVILTNRSLSIDELKKALTTLIQLHKKNLLKGIIIDELKKSSLFKRRVIEVAKKMGIIAKDSSIEEVRKVLSALLDMELIVDEAIRELLVENIDINVVEELLQKVVESKKVKIVVTKTASPFLQEISQLGSLRYIIRSSTLPRNLVIEITKQRLLNKRSKLICLVCGNVFEINIGEYLEEKCVEKNPFKCFISCPYCTSKALTVLENDNELQEFKDMLIKLKKRGFSKTDIGEYENMERASKVANLIMEYGLAALIALQGIGIGIEFAKRVLAKSHNWDSLISNILEYEENYLRTRKYWD